MLFPRNSIAFCKNLLKNGSAIEFKLVNFKNSTRYSFVIKLYKSLLFSNILHYMDRAAGAAP